MTLMTIKFQGSLMLEEPLKFYSTLFKKCGSNAQERVSILWKSDLTDKIKRSFFKAAVESILLNGCTT